MGIVFKPEPLPPGWAEMSLEEKRAWYSRVRADAVATMERQRAAFPFLPPPPPYPPQEDQPIRLGPAGSPWPICAVIVVVAAVLNRTLHPSMKSIDLKGALELPGNSYLWEISNGKEIDYDDFAAIDLTRQPQLFLHIHKLPKRMQDQRSAVEAMPI